MTRLYLDWNATTPLRPEAKAAMVAAMEVVGTFGLRNTGAVFDETEAVCGGDAWGGTEIWEL